MQKRYLFQELVEGGIKENGVGGGANSSMTYLIYCKNLCKCHSVPPTQHNNKGKSFNYKKEVKLLDYVVILNSIFVVIVNFNFFLSFLVLEIKPGLHEC
jgi:hypothetical protein